jgi:hypothetical protein
VREPRLARASLYLVLMEPTGGGIVAVERAVGGRVSRTPISVMRGESAAEIVIETAAADLTRTLSSKRSHATQQARDPSDTFYERATVTGSVPRGWPEAS